MTANKRVTDRLIALRAWIMESAEQGLTDREIVTILVSQTVRIYKVVRREPSASALLEWITRIYHSPVLSTDKKPTPPDPPEDDWGSN